MNSWYDVSIGPNLALFNHVTDNAGDPEVANNQYAIVAPTPHCRFFQTESETIVGERNMGDVRLDYDKLLYGFFDRWLADDEQAFEQENPKIRYYLMGANRWVESPTVGRPRVRPRCTVGTWTAMPAPTVCSATAD